MLALDEATTPERGTFAERRALAIENANWFRAMAWRAVRDGSPRGDLRAANARAAARIVLRQARQDAIVSRMANQALAGGP
jgi:hypothetical protein